MRSSPILLPVISLIAWTMVMWFWMYLTRIPAILKMRMRLDPLAVRGEQMNLLPPEVRWKADNYNHLMEQPTIFYALAITLAVMGEDHGANLTLAWAYVISRIIHSIFQASFNIIKVRFALFMVSSFILIALIVSAFSSYSYAHTFIPENLHEDQMPKAAPSMTEKEFNETISKVEAHYSPIIQGLGKKLVIERLWKDGRLNAEALQTGNNWIVRMYGGFARYKFMTKDSFSLVICHELGHHLAGAPKFTEALTWGSVEGQSDYFATAKCLRRVWERENNEGALTGLVIPDPLKKLCTDNWPLTEASLCLRMGRAGLDIGTLLAFLRRKATPRVDKPEIFEVDETSEGHNSAQCRLDTFIQGALCSVSYQQDFANDSEVTGSCHGRSGHKLGLRPGCWYRSLE